MIPLDFSYHAEKGNNKKYPFGRVKLFLTRFSKRSKRRLILSTDLNLNFQQAMKIYNIRWTIEVLFKECKQHLNLGKCQSNDFDAQIADTTISLLVYMMLSFHKKFIATPPWEHYSPNIVMSLSKPRLLKNCSNYLYHFNSPSLRY